MRRRRLAVLVGLALAVTSAVSGTGSFSATAADRSMEVRVAEDENAYLGLDYDDTVTVDANETTVTLVAVTNRFSTVLSVDAELTEGDPDQPPAIESVDGPGDLDSGDTGTLSATVRCDNATASESVAVALDATGGQVRVALQRELTVACA